MQVFLQKWINCFTFVALLSCFINILQLTFTFYMFTIYSNVILSYSLYSLGNITMGAFLAVVALGVFSYIRSRLLALAGTNLSRSLREPTFAVTVKGWVLDNKRAYAAGLNDLETLRSFFSSPALTSLFDVLWSPFFLALIYLMHPMLGLIATFGALTMVGLSGLQVLLVRKSLHDANRINRFNMLFVQSFLRNTEVINGMGMIGAITDRFIDENNRVVTHQTKASNRAGFIQAILKPMQNTIQVLIYCAGAFYCISEGFNVGLMVASSIIMGRGLAPLMQFTSSWQFISQARESFQHLARIETLWEQQQRPTMALSPPKGRIVFEKVVSRVSGRIVLRDINFTLEPGEFLGIIGPSGAGKSTLCRMIPGIVAPHFGRVTLDGRDAVAWNKEMIAPAIGYLPQEVELFPGTVADNIARLDQPNQQQLQRSIELAGLDELVIQLPQGIDTLLEGDDGVRLSGGQKQKIGFARAIYTSPSLLVLDEPTSNLDEQGEHRLLATLSHFHLIQACTCVMVTHKPSLLEGMDKVLVLRDGCVALFGPAKQVLTTLTDRTRGV